MGVQVAPAAPVLPGCAFHGHVCIVLAACPCPLLPSCLALTPAPSLFVCVSVCCCLLLPGFLLQVWMPAVNQASVDALQKQLYSDPELCIMGSPALMSFRLSR